MEPINDLLRSLEELGQITQDSSIYKIKPFRDWKATKWKNKIVGMRICNAGEVLDIVSYCNDIPETARSIVTIHETLIRSLWSIDDRPLVTIEELEKYNEQHKTSLSEQQYLRGWIQRLEDIVIDRLNSIYTGLQLKQIRVMNDTVSCGSCGAVFDRGKLPPETLFLKYSLAEIICSNCKKTTNLSDCDFEQLEVEKSSKIEKKADEPEPVEKPTKYVKGSSFEFTNYICACGKECEDFEEFQKHREACPKAI